MDSQRNYRHNLEEYWLSAQQQTNPCKMPSDIRENNNNENNNEKNM